MKCNHIAIPYPLCDFLECNVFINVLYGDIEGLEVFLLCFVFVIVVFSFSHYIILNKYTALWNKNSEEPWGSEKPNTYNKMTHNKDI